MDFALGFIVFGIIIIIGLSTFSIISNAWDKRMRKTKETATSGSHEVEPEEI